jgi:hypothetical protein
MSRWQTPSGEGFTLIEKVVALGLSLVTVSAVYSLYISERGVNSDVDLTNDFQGITYDPGRLTIKADLNGNGRIADANESITFFYDPKTYTLRRNTGGGNQPFGENIESFLVEYFDQVGNPTVHSASIQQVKVTVTARTEQPDPKYLLNGGYRTIALHSRLTPRNL